MIPQMMLVYIRHVLYVFFRVNASVEFLILTGARNEKQGPLSIEDVRR